MSPVLVEFVGLPGSGKSTLAEQVAMLLTQEGLELRGPLGSKKKKARRWRFHLSRGSALVRRFVGEPVVAASSCVEIALTRQRSVRELVSGTLNWFYKWDEVRRACRRDGMVIFDEGMLHALWGVNYSATRRYMIPDGIWKMLGEDLVRHWVVVDVVADPTIAFSRLRARSQGSHRAFSAPRAGGVEEESERAERALAEVRGQLHAWSQEAGHITLLEVDNTETSLTAVRDGAIRLVHELRRWQHRVGQS